MSRVTYCAEGGPQLLRCPGPAGVTREEDGAAVGIAGFVGGCGGGEEERSGSLARRSVCHNARVSVSRVGILGQLWKVCAPQIGRWREGGGQL